jgi:CheY-like chemotaxis protein
VLAVDDDMGFLEIIQAKLASQGFEAITAADGEEAVARARAVNPAVILMDVEMPNKDGITAAAELANDPATSKIPTIFVTNLNQETAEGLAARVSLHMSNKNYFRKDGDYNFLLRQIQSAVAA